MNERILHYRWFFSILMGLISFSALSLNLTRIDLSHQYDPNAPVKLEYRVVEKGSTFIIYFQIESDSMSLWSRAFLIQEGYESEDHRNFSPALKEVESTEHLWRGSISFSSEGNEDLLIVKLFADFHFYFDIPLNNGTLAFTNFAPVKDEKIITTSYLPTQDLEWTEDQIIQAVSYRNHFRPADAPMEEMKALVPILKEDTALFYDKAVLLKDYQLYYFKDDTLKDVGLSMLKTPPYYPSLRKVGELVPPMKYITTDAEYRALLRSTRAKRTFDEFWINTYGTKFRARNAIRKYFRSVELSNQYFTSIKEGWKTDQGMIFIIYGTPIEMYRNGRAEMWVYEDAEFEFIKVSTLFGPIYVLRKDRKYEKDWYKKVGDLRRG